FLRPELVTRRARDEDEDDRRQREAYVLQYQPEQHGAPERYHDGTEFPAHDRLAFFPEAAHHAEGPEDHQESPQRARKIPRPHARRSAHRIIEGDHHGEHPDGDEQQTGPEIPRTTNGRHGSPPFATASRARASAARLWAVWCKIPAEPCANLAASP